MKGRWFNRSWFAAGVAFFCMAAAFSCAVRPHGQSFSTINSSKTTVTAKADKSRAEKPREEKRAKVVKSDKKKKQEAKDTKLAAALPAAASTPQPLMLSHAESAPVSAVRPQDEPETATATAVKPESEAAPLPAPLQVSARAQTAPSPASPAMPAYRLGFGDVLDIKFLGSPEYNETVTVRPDGRISLQGIDELDVLGLSPADLDARITQAYGQILVNPGVTVIVRQSAGQKCYVAGEVDKPGSFDLAKGMTALRAIAAAGGPKKSAKMGSVILIRMDAQNRAEATRLDLSFTRDGLEYDLPVMGNDIIYVPRSFIADVNAFMSQLYEIVLPPFDSYTSYYYWKHLAK